MDRITFTVNGVKCHVGCDVSADVSLVDYLRNYLNLRGTKYMCREGGCGACIVSVIKGPGEPVGAVNACLVSVPQCHGWEITTIENVGNKHIGYHPIQKTLAEHNGTQCGYCTPGWVMAMYSLVKREQNLTMAQVEQSFASNVCRCTGYRPILDAFKKFAKDSPNPVKLTDIEDIKTCNKNGTICTKKCVDEEDEWCVVSKRDIPNIIEIDLKDGKSWFRVSTLRDIYEIWQRKGDNDYMLVGGNTAKGVLPIDEYPQNMIDISGVAELKGWKKDQNLIIYGGVTLVDLMLIILKVSAEDNDFAYLKTFYDHLGLVANLAVSNIGTIAGNLMIKRAYLGFTSDIYLFLETVGGQVTVSQRMGMTDVKKTLTMQEFLTTDMKGRVIISISLPPLNKDYKIVTYKIMPRVQNAHAVVNAGFLYRLNPADNTVIQSRLLICGLTPPSTRAHATERYLFGKKLFTDETLQSAMRIMESELVTTEYPPEPSGAYRKQLALGLFYKSLLSICPQDKLNARYKSGAKEIHINRPVSKGTQVFDTDSSLWPLNKPMPKLEALKQCAAETVFADDMPTYPHEVFGAFVLTTVAKGNINTIDASKALAYPGVIAVYTAKDIPGLNSFTPNDYLFYSANEEVLCSGVVEYYNQPLAIVVACTRYIAERAAKLVHVTYKNESTPVVDINDAIKDSNRLGQYASIDATDTGTDVDKTISGHQTIYGQYHFTMETIVCSTAPSEDGLEVHIASQWIDGVQLMISRALNMDANSIDVHCRRAGGSFGLKISRSTQFAVASALVSKKLNRPCRFISPITTNMKAIGKRLPCRHEYEVKVNKNGKIQQADYKLYMDNGYKVNEQLFAFTLQLYFNLYDQGKFNFKGYNVTTDTPKNTWCRSPGTLEAISLCETMLERISYEQDLDPIKVRFENLAEAHKSDISEMYEYLETQADYKNRRAAVDKFNTENRWKKRGLRSSFMRWVPEAAQRLDCNISVYHADGTVNITHSGIEMGQGMNTKATQIAAYFLKIPVEYIIIKGNNTIIGPNAFVTGGAVTTQNVGIAVQRACEQLLERLKPIRESSPNADWPELVKAAYNADVDLQAHGFVGLSDLQHYDIYGIAFAEVEVDMLTGQSEILRVDIIEDSGRPINPEIDIGQIEGSFVMATGYWTKEHLQFDRKTGEMLTDRTWSYHVPQARDIPQDFRIHLRKNSFTNELILGTKAVSEPPMCLAVVIQFAIREALAAARLDAGLSPKEWLQIDGPCTLETIYKNTATNIEQFKFVN